MVLFLILFIVSFLFILLFFVKIYTTIHFTHDINKNDLKLEVQFFGLEVLSKEISLNSLDLGEEDQIEQGADEESLSFIEKVRQYREFAEKALKAKPILKKFLSKVTIHHFEWETRLGTGDASVTGIVSGTLWAIKGSMSGLISSHMKVIKQPTVLVTPLFQQKYVYSHFECMVSVRLGQTIYAIIKLSKQFKRNRSKLSSKPA